VHDLARLLPHGVASRLDLTLATSASSVARWTADGRLVHVHPGVAMRPESLADPRARARAATLWAKGPLSHLSALAAWEVIPSFPSLMHVTVPADRWPRGSSGVIVHRTTPELPTATVDDLSVLHLTRSLVDAWSWAHSPKRNVDAARDRSLARQAVIESIRDRGVSVVAVRAGSAAQVAHAGRAELTRLLDLIAGGCESELEIWGVTQVLPGPPEVSAWAQQLPVRLPDGGWVRLDAAYPEALVAVELDGAAFHGTRSARERDLRRDNALASLGWVVLRFSYARLMADPDGAGGRSSPWSDGGWRIAERLRPGTVTVPGLSRSTLGSYGVRRSSRGGRGPACEARSSG
jgi:REase_MTES_1575